MLILHTKYINSIVFELQNLKSEDSIIGIEFETQQRTTLEINENDVEKVIKAEIKEENDADNEITTGNFDDPFVEYESSAGHPVKDEDKNKSLKGEYITLNHYC